MTITYYLRSSEQRSCYFLDAPPECPYYAFVPVICRSFVGRILGETVEWLKLTLSSEAFDGSRPARRLPSYLDRAVETEGAIRWVYAELWEAVTMLCHVSEREEFYWSVEEWT